MKKLAQRRYSYENFLLSWDLFTSVDSELAAVDSVFGLVFRDASSALSRLLSQLLTESIFNMVAD